MDPEDKQHISLEEEVRQLRAKLDNFSEEQKNTKSIGALSLPVAIVIAGAVVAGAVFFTNGVPRGQQALVRDAGSVAEESDLRAASNEDHILGNPNATVRIVEFSDLECPFCKQFHPTMLRIMDEYGKDGKVSWIYRHFPLDQIHPKARKEAEATECANELGGNEKFWVYIDRLFEITPSNNGLDPVELPRIAEFVGLDRARFESCLESGKYKDKIDNDLQDGLKAGVQGTPHSVAIGPGGKQIIINGAQPYEYVKSVVDSLLSGN